MTADQFQDQYHHFRTHDQDEALAALREVECEEPVAAVKIGNEYCLMLQRAADAVVRMGIVSEMWQP